MSGALGDSAEVWTDGWFNDQGEVADMPSVASRGFWRGLFDIFFGVVSLKSSAKSSLELKTISEGNIKAYTGVK